MPARRPDRSKLVVAVPMLRALRGPIALALVGCGGTPEPASSTTASSSSGGRSAVDRAAVAERAERARRSELAAAHRARLDEQATALAATCDRPAEAAARRCLPSCYPVEAPDPRAGAKIARATTIPHLVCTRADAPAGPFLIADELGGAALAIRARRGRMPRPHAKGTPHAAVEAAVRVALEPELARGDVVRVTGTWTARTHPATRERLRCVTVAHHTTSGRRALDACGAHGTIACEATGSAAAHGLNVVHYRLAEATRLRAVGDTAGCQQAALEAIAVARGLPRWRQYVTLNTERWKAVPRYRTRFDGVLDEDALFTTAIALGDEAGAVFAACGGAAAPRTTAAQEHAFHSCP